MAKPSVTDVLRHTLLRIAAGNEWDDRMPYCLHRADEYFPNDPSAVGQYLLVGRSYMPLSSTLSGTDPLVTAARSAAVIQPSTEGSVWLWNDDCIPSLSEENMLNYVARINIILGA